ncbi:hypothetical protein PCYB_147160 [Plasmodium cynomolgi strain B]|uniref:Uncharacterized protein n=1 Tax=Plasmodium cynomolgi (strain B) TaxID=1120755 RepID=K6UN96_PLACD|nr:hypothetical protein PCYB_147160 [Plasmodium cynomolgi strain B]GAB69288.1 hypothetical protein PCYB_147160 [Plasmodium cynomolgi strain B]
MSDETFFPIKDLKPLMSNLCIQCLIVKFLEDPPDHINNTVKYHYLVADISGSVILCIPRTLIQEELTRKNVDVLNDDLDDAVEWYNSTPLIMNDYMSSGTASEQARFPHDVGKKQSSGTNTANVPNLTGPSNFTKMNSPQSCKCFFRVGDILIVYGGVTTWSMGKMVIMPSTRTKKGGPHEVRGSIQRVGFFNMDVNLEPNVSNMITSTTEKKYQAGGEGAGQTVRSIPPGRSTDGGRQADGAKSSGHHELLREGKENKYDILPLLRGDDMW